MSVSPTHSNAQVSIFPDIDPAVVGYQFGHDDATEGNDQRGSAYFAPNSPAWDAYNEGFLDGAWMLYSITGQTRHVWIPQEMSA